MKILRFILCFLVYNNIMIAQSPNTKAWYMVTEKDYYILDLDELKYLGIDGKPTVTFNNSSIYKKRLAESRKNVFMDDARNGLIYDTQTDTKIIGKASVKDKDVTIKIDGQDEFTIPNCFYHVNRIETIYKDDILIIAGYYGISTGSSLVAIDTKNKKLLWRANVQQLNIPHSKYYNKVYLSLYQNKIIMEGIEAYGHYLQVFDFQTGKQLYTSILK